MKTRAITDEDKYEVMARLLVLWRANPKMRLGQLILNYYDDCDFYNTEDFHFIAHLEGFYGGLALMQRASHDPA